jgi:predicted nucleic acid-binding protein
MNFLLDTNVISELRKGARADCNVTAWFQSLNDGDLYLSALVLGEIRKGIELLRRRDVLQATALDGWLNRIIVEFADRILPVDRLVADEWGRIAALRSIPPIDALLAATAKVHGMILATRNETDFATTGVPLLNPFRSGEAGS